MAAKGHAVGVQLASMGQAEHLIAAGVGQNRTVPAHKTVQAPEAFDSIVAGAQIEMIRIGQEDGGAQFRQVARLKCLDVGGGAHGGKGRHLYGTMGRVIGGAARLAVCCVNLKNELCGHFSLKSGWEQQRQKKRYRIPPALSMQLLRWGAIQIWGEISYTFGND